MKKKISLDPAGKIAAATFGCKINQYETTCIINEFVTAGWQQVSFSQPADVYLINSCTVTNRTDYKSRNAIRKALKQKAKNPAVKVIVTGCYAQLNPQEVMDLGEIDLVIDNNHKAEIYQAVVGDIQPEFRLIKEAKCFSEQSTDDMLDRSRAIIKVQDGCDYYCAYCAVAYARGPSRSRESARILQQVERLVGRGYKEIVLAGINLGLYGREKNDGYYLENLLADLEEISGLEQIRLSSIEPQLFTDDLLNYFAKSKKICPHFHIPLQSGSDKLLKLMGRRYTVEEFREKVQQILKIFPDAALGFDVICGLPGESEEVFQETEDFLKGLSFTYLHVFPYSRRPGTRAFDMPMQVKGDISHERVLRLSRLAEEKNLAYRKQLIAEKTRLRVVIESEREGYYTGLSDHFVRIWVKDSLIEEGDLVEVRAIELKGSDLLVEMIR